MATSAVLVFAAHLTLILAAQNATYMCFFDGEAKRIDMSIEEGPGEPEILKVFSDVSGSECDITLTEERFSIVINDTEPMCGITNGTVANPSGNGYKLTAITSSAVGAITITDAKYVINCEFDVINTEISITVDPTTIVNGVVATGTAMVEKETVSLAIKDGSGNNVVAVTFGDTITLQASLSRRSIAGAATGIAIHDCSAVNDLSNPTKSVIMISSNGCTSPGLSLFADGTGFTKDVGSTVGLYVTNSPSFKAFIMSDGTATIAFRCNATFCYGGETKCDKSCETGSRKKRQAERFEESAPETKEVVAILTVSSNHIAALHEKNKDAVETKRKEEEVATCTAKVNVVGMAILGVILALTVVVALGFFAVIMRTKQAASGKTVSD